jgi:hypothetical protein
LKLNKEQAVELSSLFTYKELHRLKKAHANGRIVTDLEKKIALEASLDPYSKMIDGGYSIEELKELVSEWEDFFSSNYFQTYMKYIEVIQSVKVQINSC